MGGKQIRLFLVDGTPGGVRTAEITNWTGHVLAGERSDLAALLARQEVKRTGVYVLVGDDADGGRERCYIGEADDVGARLRNHERTKDFWDRVIVITSKDANLTKAHARYLEASLIRLAGKAGRVGLENGTAPENPNLPEADAADMDYFVGQLQIVLPVLGVNAFRTPSAPKVVAPAEAAQSPTFRLVLAKQGIDARAQQIDGEFTLLPRSTIAPGVRGIGKAEAVQRTYAAHAARFEQYVADGQIRVEGQRAVVLQPIIFTSPSAAGVVVTGRSCNGRIEWRTDEGVTFGEWEARGLTD